MVLFHLYSVKKHQSNIPNGSRLLIPWNFPAYNVTGTAKACSCPLVHLKPEQLPTKMTSRICMSLSNVESQPVWPNYVMTFPSPKIHQNPPKVIGYTDHIWPSLDQFTSTSSPKLGPTWMVEVLLPLLGGKLENLTEKARVSRLDPSLPKARRKLMGLRLNKSQQDATE